jgi:hypothetical protein
MSPPGETLGAGESLGSAAEEARKLLAALQDFTRRTTGEHIATGGPECRLCPLCQLISVVRDTRPEVAEHLGSAAASLLSALRAALQQGQEDRPGVQHIDIG